MARNNIFNQDQTIFVDQAPLWQKTSQEKIDLKKNLTKNKNLKPFYFLMASVFLIFAFYIIVVFLPKREERVVVVEPEIEEELLEAHPLEQRINSLKEDLKDADPTRQSLAFPNINFKISFP
jgi:cell division protein FtsL